jgi:hypothetical protein
MDKLSALRTGLENTVKTRNNVGKTTCKIDDENQLEEQFISSQAFHWTPSGRVQEITAEVQFKLGNLNSFDPMTEESYRQHPANSRTQTESWYSFSSIKTNTLWAQGQQPSPQLTPWARGPKRTAGENFRGNGNRGHWEPMQAPNFRDNT